MIKAGDAMVRIRFGRRGNRFWGRCGGGASGGGGCGSLFQLMIASRNWRRKYALVMIGVDSRHDGVVVQMRGRWCAEKIRLGRVVHGRSRWAGIAYYGEGVVSRSCHAGQTCQICTSLVMMQHQQTKTNEWLSAMVCMVVGKSVSRLGRDQPVKVWRQVRQRRRRHTLFGGDCWMRL